MSRPKKHGRPRKKPLESPKCPLCEKSLVGDAAPTRESLEKISCGNEDCTCTAVELDAPCHPEAGQRISYCKVHGILWALCAQCQAVTTIFTLARSHSLEILTHQKELKKSILRGLVKFKDGIEANCPFCANPFLESLPAIREAFDDWECGTSGCECTAVYMGPACHEHAPERLFYCKHHRTLATFCHKCCALTSVFQIAFPGDAVPHEAAALAAGTRVQ